jgi:uncharacterized membrane protein
MAVTFEEADPAEDALASVRKLDGNEGVSVHDAAVVVRTAAGRIELQQTHQVAAGEGIVAGGSVGLLAGMLLGFPVGGALLGLAGGAGLGLRDTGIPDGRLRELGEALELGHAALCVLVERDPEGRVRAALAGYGDVLELELSTRP